MLTLLKKIFTWWNQRYFWNKIKNYFFGKFVGSDDLEINITRVKMEKDGLFIQKKLMQLKYL